MEALAKAKHHTKDVINRAKFWVAECYVDENIENIGLEEVSFENGIWNITIGFQKLRLADHVTGFDLIRSDQSSNFEKKLKIISISDDTGDILSMQDRLVG